tara:strand:- start:17181 stop:18251 length:1071 start_codon:yes stop_codon:yes gene_type:complete
MAGLARGDTILARHTGIETIAGEQQWLLCETSGSSGAPKTIRRSPQSWQHSFAITAKNYAITATYTYVTLGPINHSLSLYATLEALHIGANIAALSGTNPRAQMRHVASFNACVIYATPAQLGLLLQGAIAEKLETTSSVRHIFCGGGALNETLRAQILAAFPLAQLHAFFGASETSFITITDDKTPPGSVGRTYPGVQLRLDDSGEIWVKSPYLFSGYANGAAQDTRWDGAYLSIGEIGHLDPQGYLFVQGRKSRMVTVADHNVFPEQIEELLLTVTSIIQCAAIALPDSKRGQRIICVLQSTGNPDLVSLRQLCQRHLGAPSVPKEFVVVPEMPLLPAGKPDLAKLLHWLKDRT